MPPTKDPPPPIAIIGMGLRLPGGVSTPQDFWNLLVNKKHGQCRVPADRYNVDAFYGDKVTAQTVATEYGYFLDNVNLKHADASFFSINSADTESSDPQLRLLLEVIWECMESAGQTTLRGSDAGVFLGVFGEDWHDIQHRDVHLSLPTRPITGGDFALANRLSYEFDFRGPSMTIRTACSASLSALHLACQAVQIGDCSTAIVAGSSLIMSPTMTLDMTEQGVLSPTGSCKTFDANADGFARGEAINAVMIKLLDDAIRDGDPIRAVIRSTAVTSDGRTSHMGSPSVVAQEAMIRKAYEKAGIDDFAQTAFVECHGTGTSVGDPIEAAAVGNVFGESGVYIGSVKPNVGHGEGASGITSLIKAVLALENETIPPNINFSTPNPNIDFDKHKLEVPVEPVPWPKHRHARVSVNSFGIGGANAHVILDSAASFGVPRPNRCLSEPPRLNGNSEAHVSNGSSEAPVDANSEEVRPNGDFKEPAHGSVNHKTNASPRSWPRLVPLSASDAESLKRRTQHLKEYIESHPGCQDGVAYTLGIRRVHLPYRNFAVVDDGNAALEFSVPQKAKTSTAKVAFIFTGQGAQWAGMGRTLIETSEAFRDNIRGMDAALQRLDEPPSWTIEETLCSNDLDIVIGKAEYSQPLCTALQIALVDFLATNGIVPSAVAGHSSGEIAAAYAAGALTQTEAVLCSYFRGLAVKKLQRSGRMAAIGMGRIEIEEYLVTGAGVACENSPKSVTISGDADAVRQTVEAIKSRDPSTFTRELRVDVAYHSDHMSEVGDYYEDLLASHLSPKAVAVPLYSTVSGHAVTAKAQLGPSYWRSNLESPVLFDGAIQTLLDDMKDMPIFLEVGPHSALQGPLRQIFEQHTKVPPSYISTLSRDKDCVDTALAALGQLYSYGYPVDFSLINPVSTILTDLPNYPWDHTTDYWKESRISAAWRLRKHPHHELLGSSCTEATDSYPMWRNILNTYNSLWIADHRVANGTVFPCAGYISMMGEAIRQVLGTEAYQLRNLMVKSALMIAEGADVELMTTMRPYRLTELTNSSWHEISISSFNGTSWEENCVAQGKSGDDVPDTELDGAFQPLPRQVSERMFYEQMAYQGIKYGPRFKGLQNISAHTEKLIARAMIRNDPSEQEAKYAVHPTTIDYCLQLGAVAACHGVPRSLTSIKLPVDIRHIYVSPGGPELRAEARIDERHGENVVATTSENKVAVRLANGRGIAVDIGDESRDTEALHAARLEWLPHIDYIEPKSLVRRGKHMRNDLMLFERATTLLQLRIFEVLKQFDISPRGHLGKYVSWLQTQRELIVSGKRDHLVMGAQDSVLLAPESQLSLLKSAVEDLLATGNTILVNLGHLVARLADADIIRGIFSGELNPLEPLGEGDGLVSLYNLRVNMDCGEFFKLCGHAKPSMKILEIGAGTGGFTEIVLQHLKTKQGTRLFSQYTFTDISAGFFQSAEERFKDWSGITYKTLDIEKDPVEQGFELGHYDLVIASNVLHATASLRKTLQNVRSLLRPNGRLFLEELTHSMGWQCISTAVGLFPGWWAGDADGRPDMPLATFDRWDQELRETGFSGTNVAVLDDEPTFSYNGYMITTAIAPPPSMPSDVTILYYHEKHEFGRELAVRLEKNGIRAQWCKLGDPGYIRGQDIVSTVELEDPYFSELSKETYSEFQDFISGFNGRMLWLTRPSMVACVDPRYALTVGLARVIRLEMSTHFWIVELDELNNASTVAVEGLLPNFFNSSSLVSGQLADYEFSVRNGILNIGRFHWLPLSKELELPLEDNDPKHMVIGQLGSMDSIHWEQCQPDVLGANDVEVDIRHVGINFRDIMLTLGLIEGAFSEIGLEGSGIIRRVGSAVDNVKVGDRIMTMYKGLTTTRTTLSAKRVVRIPEGLSLEEATTLPVVYLTVIHSVVNLGKLSGGQSILIHSACGGVGQAAIHICKMLGAEIFTTVGTEEKVTHLVENFGIPRDRIFNSRNISFYDDLMKATNGRGVDIVLNSLSGELLHASWRCVAKNGSMLEIGKRDIFEHGQLALDVFASNRTFYGVDLRELVLEDPEYLIPAMDQLLKYYDGGYVKPIQPITSFPAEKVSEAFQFMKKGQHMGKIIISMPEDPKELPATKQTDAGSFSSTSTYLMVGGFGGIGRSIASWMAERGARSFAFLSRSAGKSAEDQAFIRELEFQGCHVVVVAGSVAEMDDVRRVIDATLTPIGGVLLASMVLRDRSFVDMSYEDWRTTLDPKVKGVWNLHEALSGVDLDFFVLLASLVGVVGLPGQANYSAANAFLDSFVQFRHSLNLPCSALDISAVEGIGILSEDQDVLTRYSTNGVYLVQEQQILDAFQISIKPSLPVSAAPVGPNGGWECRAQLGIGFRSTIPMNNPANRTLFRDDIRFDLYRQIEKSEDAVSDKRDEGLRSFLESVATCPDLLHDQDTKEHILLEVGRTLYTFMVLPLEDLDLSVTLESVGVDSLVGIELRNWLRRSLGLNASVLDIMNTKTIEGLGNFTITALQEKYGVKRDGGKGE